MPILMAVIAQSLSLTAPELLERAISYHDPAGSFRAAAYTIELTETRPRGPSRTTTIEIDNARGRFEMRRRTDDGSETRIVVEGDDVTVEGDPNLGPDRARRTRDYYAYLYGLPMKLLDDGTRLDPAVKRTDFQGREAYELRVTYDEAVGSDTWYFYLHPESYALIGYRFYHDESQNDGEYIVLEGESEGAGVRLPKTRRWYRHADDGFLGTDTIEAIRRPRARDGGSSAPPRSRPGSGASE